jgi:hypothetical protein
MGHSLDDLGQRIPPEWSLPGQKLIEDDAQAEEVRTPIDEVTFASGLFWAHIRWRASQSATFAEVLILEGEPEVGDTGLARGIDEDVGGLDVPVDQPPGCGRNARRRRSWRPVPPTPGRTDDLDRS